MKELFVNRNTGRPAFGRDVLLDREVRWRRRGGRVRRRGGGGNADRIRCDRPECRSSLCGSACRVGWRDCCRKWSDSRATDGCCRRPHSGRCARADEEGARLRGGRKYVLCARAALFMFQLTNNYIVFSGIECSFLCAILKVLHRNFESNLFWNQLQKRLLRSLEG